MSAPDLTQDRIMLGCLLHHGPEVAEATDIKPEDFATPSHGDLWRWLMRHADEWTAGNVPTILAAFNASGLTAKLENPNSAAFDFMQAAEGIGAEGFTHYAATFTEAAATRRLREAAGKFNAGHITLGEYERQHAELSARAAAREGGIAKSLPPFLSLVELDEQFPEPPPLLIGGNNDEDERDGALLARGEVGVLGSASKVGKTWCGIDLALCVATGGRWMDHFICKPGRVLYVNMELGGNSFKQRTEMILRARGIKAPKVIPFIKVWQLRNTRMAAVEELGDLLGRRGEHFDLIILDPLYKLLGTREENSNGEMSELMSVIRERFCNGDQTAVLIIHHFPKGDMSKRSSLDRFAGAGAVARDADSLITITPDGDNFRLEATARDHKSGPPLELKIEFPVVDVAGIAEAVTPKAKAAENSAVLRRLVEAETGMDKAELVKRFMVESGCGKSMAYKAIERAEKARAIYRTTLEKTYCVGD